jgi:hypothetical protein
MSDPAKIMLVKDDHGISRMLMVKDSETGKTRIATDPACCCGHFPWLQTQQVRVTGGADLRGPLSAYFFDPDDHNCYTFCHQGSTDQEGEDPSYCSGAVDCFDPQYNRFTSGDFYQYYDPYIFAARYSPVVIDGQGFPAYGVPLSYPQNHQNDTGGYSSDSAVSEPVSYADLRATFAGWMDDSLFLPNEIGCWESIAPCVIEIDGTFYPDPYCSGPGGVNGPTNWYKDVYGERNDLIWRIVFPPADYLKCWLRIYDQIATQVHDYSGVTYSCFYTDFEVVTGRDSATLVPGSGAVLNYPAGGADWYATEYQLRKADELEDSSFGVHTGEIYLWSRNIVLLKYSYLPSDDPLYIEPPDPPNYWGDFCDTHP